MAIEINLTDNTSIPFSSLSLTIGIVLYLFLGFIFDFEHPFLEISSLLIVFLASHLVITLLVYWISFKKDMDRSKNKEEIDLPRTRRAILIVISALVLSALFPAFSHFGIYPISMSVFHLLIIFYAAQSFIAIVITIIICLWKSGRSVSILTKLALLSALTFLLIISYIDLLFFYLLPVK